MAVHVRGRKKMSDIKKFKERWEMSILPEKLTIVNIFLAITTGIGYGYALGALLLPHNPITASVGLVLFAFLGITVLYEISASMDDRYIQQLEDRIVELEGKTNE